MHAPPFLADLVLVLGAALVVVLLLSRARLPTIAGFIVAGALLGPSGFALISDASQIEELAEVGVALLLFTIGLELSPARLRRLWRVIAIGGSLQVGLTVAAVMGVTLLAGGSWRRGLFFGFLVALSSTAIVLRALAERREVDAPHGRLIVGALVFQDLCVVPMMLVLPLLDQSDASPNTGAMGLLWALGKAALLVAGTLVVGRLVIPRALAIVAASKRRELFVLAVLVLCGGIAWLTSLAGLSLALGAFLAGIALADSEHGHQALSDVLPLRETLVSLFFVSVGMLFDVGVVLRRPALVLGLVVAVLIGKALLASLAALAMRFPPRVAVLAGVGLAQIGEFSFVLARTPGGGALLQSDERGIFVAMSVITMVVTPLLLRLGPHLAAGAANLRGLERLIGARGVGDSDEDSPAKVVREGHVVIAGYGVAGRILADALRSAGVPHLAVELNSDIVREARLRGEPVYYGDVTSIEILEHAGVPRAAAVVVLINDADAARRAVHLARRLAPEATIAIRTRFVADAEELMKLGANEVVAEEREAAVELVERLLRRTAGHVRGGRPVEVPRIAAP